MWLQTEFKTFWFSQRQNLCPLFPNLGVPSGGSKGGREGRTPPLGIQILSISCSFWENSAKLCVHAPPLEGSRPPLGEILDPSLVPWWRLCGDPARLCPWYSMTRTLTFNLILQETIDCLKLHCWRHFANWTHWPHQIREQDARPSDCCALYHTHEISINLARLTISLFDRGAQIM